MSKPQVRIRQQMDQYDLVRHLYSRRVQWGTENMLYRKDHPMVWRKVTGNYQNWEVNTSEILPSVIAPPKISGR